MRNSHTHVVYAFIPNAEEPIAIGFGKSDVRALRDVKTQLDGMRARPHDSLAIDAPVNLYYIRSNGNRVFAGAY